MRIRFIAGPDIFLLVRPRIPLSRTILPVPEGKGNQQDRARTLKKLLTQCADYARRPCFSSHTRIAAKINLFVLSRVWTATEKVFFSGLFAFRSRLDRCSALYLVVATRSRISRDRLPSGKRGTPPCRSGQLKKDLGFDASSVADVGRVRIEIMNSFFVSSTKLRITRKDPNEAHDDMRSHGSSWALKSRNAVSQRRFSLRGRPSPGAKDAMKRRTT
jgi:hypothetical protein